jgi:hypothetical protein
MRTAVQGIMYPLDAGAQAREFALKAGITADTAYVNAASVRPYIEIPHAAWEKCQIEIEAALTSGTTVTNGTSVTTVTSVTNGTNRHGFVFFLAPLHKGVLDWGNECEIYAPQNGLLKGPDWEIGLEVPSALEGLVRFSDDVCSEEQSLEIAAPYLAALFPGVPVCALFAGGNGPEVKRIVDFIGKHFSDSPVFLSNNSEACCARAWKEAFGS